jgi:hypothetical protein
MQAYLDARFGVDFSADSHIRAQQYLQSLYKVIHFLFQKSNRVMCIFYFLI